MALTTLYKPGRQGYWARVLTAVGGAIVLAAGAHWAWTKLGLIAWDHRIYLQAVAALVILLVGGFLLYRAVGTKPRTVDFLIATEGEMNKVNWPTRREVIGSTWVVVAFLFLMVGLLFAADFAFASIFELTGVLDVRPDAVPTPDAATP